MTLHPAIGPNRYCGPGALAILTGMDTGETARLLRVVTGRSRICGVRATAMLRVLEAQGIYARPIPLVQEGSGIVVHRPTLRVFAHWLTERRNERGIYLVIVTNHYVILDTREYFPMVSDNMTIYPVRMDAFKRARKHVVNAWRIEPTWQREALENV